MQLGTKIARESGDALAVEPCVMWFLKSTCMFYLLSVPASVELTVAFLGAFVEEPRIQKAPES